MRFHSSPKRLSLKTLLIQGLLLLTGLTGGWLEPCIALAQSDILNHPSPNGTLSPTVPPTQAGDYFHLQKQIIRWSDQTRFVTVHVSAPAYLPDWQAWNPQIVKDAFGEWQRALNNRLIFVFTEDTAHTDMVVNWWNFAAPGVESGAAGFNTGKLWGKYMSENDIFIALHNTSGHLHTPQELYRIALHEIGHSLGIKTHSDHPDDIMYPVTTERSRLSQRDINTLLKIYASKPHYVNPPGYPLSRFPDFQRTQKTRTGLRIPIPIVIPIPL